MRPEEELGKLLKTKREERGLSIEEIVQETKIRSQFIRAIEQGQFQVIPGEVYLKGFIKNYSKVLGLDPNETAAMIPLFESEAALYPSSLKSGSVTQDNQKAEKASGYEETQRLRRKKVSDAPSAYTQYGIGGIIRIVIIILVFAVALAYVYNSVILPNLPDPVENGSSGGPGENGDDQGIPEPVEPEPLPPEITIISDSSTNAVVELKAEIIEITITATARCWLRVQEDDDPAESQTLRPGDTVTFSARREISMRAGNSGGINIYLNDELLEVSGRSGGVKNYTITLVP